MVQCGGEKGQMAIAKKEKKKEIGHVNFDCTNVLRTISIKIYTVYIHKKKAAFRFVR